MEEKSVRKRVTTSRKRTSAREPRQAAASCLKFLKSTHSAVRSHMAAASDLPTFLESAGALSLNGRKRLVEQAFVLINDNFVHLPLKESMHGVDPVQKLRLIQHRLDQSTSSTMDSEFKFHRDMVGVFTSVRDLHTNYLLPAPFADKVAFLPFDVEEYFDNGEPHYIATHFVQGFSHTHFKQGVEITTWNGVPIRRAIDVSADQHAGSNSACWSANLSFIVTWSGSSLRFEISTQTICFLRHLPTRWLFCRSTLRNILITVSRTISRPISCRGSRTRILSKASKSRRGMACQSDVQSTYPLTSTPAATRRHATPAELTG